jgi:voltage-gated potassium channel
MILDRHWSGVEYRNSLTGGSPYDHRLMRRQAPLRENHCSRMSISLRRFSSIELLPVLIALFITLPFVETIRAGTMIESILISLVLISAIFAIAANKWVLAIAILLAFPALLGRWIHQFRPDLMPPEVFLIGGILFVLFVIINLLRFALAAKSVSTEVLCASISAYLLLGLLWTFGYWLVAELVPNAFSFSGPDTSLKGFNGLYFSFITISTVGYGDITPVARVARLLAAMEAVTGLLYVAVLIARLVSLDTISKSHES